MVLVEKFVVVFDSSSVTLVTVSMFYNKTWMTRSIGHDHDHVVYFAHGDVVTVAWMEMLSISNVTTMTDLTILIGPDYDIVWIPKDYNHEPFWVSFRGECPWHRL